jgi:hypothetical protein
VTIEFAIYDGRLSQPNSPEIAAFSSPVHALCRLGCFEQSAPRAAEGKFFSANPRPDLAGYSYAPNAGVTKCT